MARKTLISELARASMLAGLAALLASCEPAAQDDRPPLAVIGGTLIDGTGAPAIPDASVIVEDGRIICAGPRDECPAPADARVIDAVGKWIMPGLVDAHMHFSQSGWIDTRPETADLPVDDRYESAIEDLRQRPDRVFRALLCSGITGVADVGGYAWTTELPDRAERDPYAPRVSAAGPLLTFIEYPLVYQGEHQMVTLSDSAGTRSAVQEIVEFGPAYVKLWYIVDPRRGVDSTTARGLAELVASETRARGLPLIVHATGLWEAKHAVEIGATVLVHSVFNGPVDDEFLRAARESGVIYTPTILVPKGYVNMRLGVFAPDPADVGCADPEVVRSWTDWQSERTPATGQAREQALERLRQREATTLDNLRRVHEAGITIALGTDSGNPMTLHGSAILGELELMRKGGLSEMDVIVSATRNAARVMGRGDDLGTLEAGKLADLLVLSADPLADLSAFDRIEWIIRGGAPHRREDLRPGGGE